MTTQEAPMPADARTLTPTGASETQLLTLEETASRLRVHINTVRRLVKSGELPVVRIGPLVRIKLSDVLAFIEGRYAG